MKYHAILFALFFCALFSASPAYTVSDGNPPDGIQLAANENFFDKIKRAFSGKPKEEPVKKKGFYLYGLTRTENREIQEMLTALGYQPGTADGLPGRKTRQAIRHYQTTEELTADGKPSRQLLEHLRVKTNPQPVEERATAPAEHTSENEETRQPLSIPRPAVVVTESLRRRYVEACEGSDERAPGISCPFVEEDVCIGDGCRTGGVVQAKMPTVLYKEPGSSKTAYIAKRGEILVYEKAATFSVPCPVTVSRPSWPELSAAAKSYRLSDSGEGVSSYLIDGNRIPGVESDKVTLLAECVRKDEWWLLLKTENGAHGWSLNEHNTLTGTLKYDNELGQLPEWVHAYLPEVMPQF